MPPTGMAVRRRKVITRSLPPEPQARATVVPSGTVIGGRSGEDAFVDAHRAQRIALPRERRGAPGISGIAETGHTHCRWPQCCWRSGARRKFKPQNVMAPFIRATYDWLFWVTESVLLVQLDLQGPAGGPKSEKEEALWRAAVPPPPERRR